MKRLVLGGAAMLLVLATIVTRPVNACPIGYDPGSCNAAQCRTLCQAQGGGGTCVYQPCHVSCVCLS